MKNAGSCAGDVLVLEMLRVVLRVVSTDVCTELLVVSVVVGRCTLKRPGSCSLSNGVEFGIALYFNIPIYNFSYCLYMLMFVMIKRI